RDAAGNIRTTNTNDSVDLSVFDNGNPGSSGTLTASRYIATPNRIYLNWPGATDSCWTSGSISYQICREVGGSCASWTPYTTTGGGVTALNLPTQQSANTTYAFGVRAVDGEGNIGPISTVSVKTYVSWDDNLESYFNGGCSGCHGTGGWTYAEM